LQKPHYHIKENSWLASIAAYKLGSEKMALVLGKTIHLHHCSREAFLANEKWLKHELCHLKQFKEHGYLTFLCKYLWETLKVGYHQNKYEVAARQAENED
jgi:hypothetical protein